MKWSDYPISYNIWNGLWWALICLLIAGIYGWFANIVKLFLMMGEPVTTATLFRIVGVFVAPIGAILGFI